MNVKIKADFTTQKCHWLWFLHTYAAWNIMFIFFPTFFFLLKFKKKKKKKNTVIEALPHLTTQTVYSNNLVILHDICT